MRKKTRSLVFASAFVVMIGAIFLGGRPQPSSGQITGREGACGCYTCYFPGVSSLYVNFPDPPTNCSGILAKDACPAVMAQMPDKGERYCQKIKKELGLTSFKDCPEYAAVCKDVGACGSQAWEDYKRDLKIVLGLWDDADKEFDRGMKEFQEAKDDILRDMVGFPVEEFGEEVAGEVAGAGLTTITKWLTKKIENAKYLIKPLGEWAAGTAAGLSVISTVAETGMIAKNAKVTVDNLEYSSQSQNKMRLRADEKWKQVLDNLDRALELDKACEEANAELAAKAKAERKLEERARRYMEENFDNFHKTYRIGSKDYKDANAALDAAKEIIEAHYRGRSGYIKQESFIHLAAYTPSSALFGSVEEDQFIQPYELQEALRQLELAETHLRRGTTLLVREIQVYRDMRQNLRSIRSRMGTGLGPEPEQQLLPAPKQTPKIPMSRP